MLTSVTIQRRQSELREKLADLAGKDKPSEDEIRQLGELETSYKTNELQLRAALISEEAERREAGKELETRSDREYSDLIGKFELRQVALALDEGRPLDGATAEVVQEMRNQGGYRGVPVPWQALELRAGETVASGTPDPISTRPIIDRLFPGSVAGQMGAQMINIDHGEIQWPVTSSEVSAGWATSENGNVAAATAYETVDRPLAPDYNLGVQMKLTRKTMKQSGSALEAAVRRDMAGAIAAEMDRVVFLGSGSSGEPLGIIPYAEAQSPATITVTPVDAAASWSAFRSACRRFMTGNAATGPKDVRLMIRPEVWDNMDGDLITNTAVSEWDRMAAQIGRIVTTSNALADPTGSPEETKAIMTTSAGGVSPIFVGVWGGVDLIRDPYSDAASGGLRLTGLATMDITFSRAAQIEVLTGIQ